ncbi:IS3 family transposase [Allorhizobium ampelinum S4]|uniref:IS3 family transposase n=2 Tax=Allorhizobium TaxID=78526 RepID=B9JTH2_ALLAM|nr:IS3 family transposase [Allorhizobium ampelinum S4]
MFNTRVKSAIEATSSLLSPWQSLEITLKQFWRDCDFSPVNRFSYKGEDVVQTLERVCRQVGYPATIRVDNGSEFISRDLDLWAYHRGVVLDFSRPGKPTDNSYIESFNGKFRAECLNAHWFMSLDDARAKMEDWRRDYNEFRPHSAIGNKVPISLMNGSPAPPPT